MSNSRFSILQAVAVKDKRISDSQFRTLAALGMYTDEEGWCYPSLVTLGKDLSKSKQSVGRDTIALKKLGYLEVKSRYDNKSGARHSNLYRLRFDLPPRQLDVDPPSAKLVDPPSALEADVNVPINVPINDNTKPDFVDFAIEQSRRSQKRQDALNAFESALGFSSLNWDAKPEWRKFAKWVQERHAENPTCFVDYATWRKVGGKYHAMNNNKIRQNPLMFVDTGWPTYLASTSMYGTEGRKPVQRDRKGIPISW